MRSIEVLLRDRVEKLGKCGDVVKVAAGYARNYLLPNRLAIAATEENKRAMARRRERLDVEEAARAEEVRARVEALSGLALETSAKADEAGHLYGSVNAAKVAALIRAKGFEVSDKDVRLESGPIKLVGEHAIAVHVLDEQYATVQLTVAAEAAEAAGA